MSGIPYNFNEMENFPNQCRAFAAMQNRKQDAINIKNCAQSARQEEIGNWPTDFMVLPSPA